MKSTADTSKRQKIRSMWEEKLINFLQSRQSDGLHALYEKEMRDNITSKRFLVILALIVVTSLVSLYGAVQGLSDATSNEYMFLAIYTTSGNSIPSFMSFIALLGPFVGIVLGFDAITGEKSDRTLYRLATQPIYRDSIINGKFLAGMSIIFMMVYAMGAFLGAAGILALGIRPTSEEVWRVIVFLFFTAVYISFWLALSLWLSVVSKNAAASAMTAIGIWLFFSLFMTMVAQMIANVVYPMTTELEVYRNQLGNYQLDLTLNRISPYYLYSEAVSTIMNPSVRSVSVITMESLSGAISSYLSLGQSLLLVWPHLAGLIALMLISFAGSYICFMRQEIRAK